LNAIGGTATAASSQICPATPSSLLNLTGYCGAIQWQSSICSAPFQDVVGATSSSYNVTSADGTGTSFRAKVICGSTIAYSNTKIVSQYNVCNPSIRNIPVCYIGGGGSERKANTSNNSNTNLFDQINVFPNPATNELSVELISLEGSDIGITIYDLLGKIVYNSNDKNGSASFKQTIDVSEFKRGIYYIKINDNINTYYNKLILQ
jgi:hypothetical protein